MKSTEDIRPISYMKANAADLLNQVNATHRAVVITQSGKVRAILQDPETYEQTRAAMGLLKLLVQSEQEILTGKVHQQSDVFARIEKRLAEQQDSR